MKGKGIFQASARRWRWYFSSNLPAAPEIRPPHGFLPVAQISGLLTWSLGAGPHLVLGGLPSTLWRKSVVAPRGLHGTCELCGAGCCSFCRRESGRRGFSRALSSLCVMPKEKNSAEKLSGYKPWSYSLKIVGPRASDLSSKRHFLTCKKEITEPTLQRCSKYWIK